MSNINAQPATSNTTAKAKIELGRLTGSFGRFQFSAYGDLKRVGIDAKVAHKVAFDYGADIGNALKNANDDKLKTQVGKASKDGNGSIKLSASGYAAMSPAMKLIRIAQVLFSLKAEELVTDCTLDMSTLSKSIKQYVESCEEWASKREFVESLTPAERKENDKLEVVEDDEYDAQSEDSAQD